MKCITEILGTRQKNVFFLYVPRQVSPMSVRQSRRRCQVRRLRTNFCSEALTNCAWQTCAALRHCLGDPRVGSGPLASASFDQLLMTHKRHPGAVFVVFHNELMQCCRTKQMPQLLAVFVMRFSTRLHPMLVLTLLSLVAPASSCRSPSVGCLRRHLRRTAGWCLGFSRWDSNLEFMSRVPSQHGRIGQRRCFNFTAAMQLTKSPLQRDLKALRCCHRSVCADVLVCMWCVFAFPLALFYTCFTATLHLFTALYTLVSSLFARFEILLRALWCLL